MDILSSIVLATSVAVVAVAVGAKVQKVARFIYPVDFMTIGILVLIALDALFGISHIEPYWYVPFLVGYMTGYVIAGRQDYLMVERLDFGAKLQTTFHWVVFTEEGKSYIQIQSNKELFKRLVLGIRQELITNVPIGDCWVSVARYPLFPEFKTKILHVEHCETSFRVTPIFWKFSAKKYMTIARLSYGDMVSRWQLMEDEAALDQAQMQVVDLTKRVCELERESGTKLMEYAMQMDVTTGAKSPENRMADLLRRGTERTTKKKSEEKETDNGTDDKGNAKAEQ